MAIAIERRDWQSVALYLLLGVAEAARALPEESLAELLDLLGEARGSERDGGTGPAGD